MAPLPGLLSPWEGPGELRETTPALLAYKCRQPGPVTMAAFGVAHHPGDLGKFSGTAEVLCAEACFLCKHLLWSPPLNGRSVKSGSHSSQCSLWAM